jgi:NADPH-dependent glutamate synthase beta subunit-like oxidoreductase
VRVQPGTLQTTRERVWAAGDLVNGGATVVQAVAEGMRAAREIDAALKGAGVARGG